MRTAITATVNVVAMKTPPQTVIDPIVTLFGMFLWLIVALGLICFIFSCGIMVAQRYDMVPGLKAMQWMSKNIIGCMVAGVAAPIAGVVVMGTTGTGGL
ncbi:hypothetical protein AXK56_16370 [Tsukamurella pulmonis]|uniref:Uncharacterized protein n=1 Tax=Tsukamurella pulmonis TaxID=47312 RepID=A0A1H1A7C3_9ACTN|nr:hypothetical protein [Tsukamurella pulmonis]KXO95786.1 hypothetical protein AXK56_16370 [Tsukamurella pulmonis]SDQ35553.1 hypothetical protein SAMN04489765_0087 [Tsukamurella pulmonis]SUQ39451.1 Uncharacterised protein [Tsukamurella pulmonis]